MPRIGITYRFTEKYGPYRDAVLAAGMEPVPILPPGVESLAGLDGLLVSGGTDLDPSLYGQEPHPENESPDLDRDRMEQRLLREAIASNLPVLCICRGLQLMNVTLGGDLHQHLGATDVHLQRGIVDAHVVKAVEGTALASIVGQAGFSVNSRHHQGVCRLAPDLIISAWSSDGVIEGLELPGQKFAVAVQWHPEDRVGMRKADTDLFQAFRRAVECG